jgi:hypothetical protein
LTLAPLKMKSPFSCHFTKFFLSISVGTKFSRVHSLTFGSGRRKKEEISLLGLSLWVS